MKFTITYYSNIDQPYHYSKNGDDICKHISYDSFVVDSFDLCMKCIKDFIDSPKHELTLDQIYDDFNSPEYPLDEEYAKKIQVYYNGRFNIHQKIVKEITNIVENISLLHDMPITKRYEIPNECYAFDTDEMQCKNNETYIEVNIEK